MAESPTFRCIWSVWRELGIKGFGCLSLVLALVVTFVSSCKIKERAGELLVRAPNPGSFEIYRIESEEPLQFISEQVGEFNQPLKLPAGHYLILADCSYENVILRPDENRTLVAHQ